MVWTIDPPIWLAAESWTFSRVSTMAAVELLTPMYQKKHKPAFSSACAPKLIYKVPRGLPSLKVRKIGRLRRGVRFRD